MNQRLVHKKCKHANDKPIDTFDKIDCALCAVRVIHQRLFENFNQLQFMLFHNLSVENVLVFCDGAK